MTRTLRYPFESIDMQKTAQQTTSTQAIYYEPLWVSSPAFKAYGAIPKMHTCDGANVNPPIDIKGIPRGATSLALVVDDPDAPIGTWSHWLVWNIPVTHQIRSNHGHGEEGKNDFQQNRYDGPCPHAGKHHYRFKVYALDSQLSLGDSTRQIDLEKAMAGHILAFGELIGTYQRDLTP